MAKYMHGINGPILGRVGKVSGSSWKGIPYLKGPYKERTKKVSATELANRDKFGMAQDWLHPLLKFVRESYKGYSTTVHAYNAAKKYLLQHAFEGEGAGRHINPALMQVSYGELPLPGQAGIEKAAVGSLRFSWDTAVIPGSHARDQAMLLAYDVENGKGWYTINGQYRSMGTDLLPVPPDTGRTYHVYIAFTAPDRGRQSASLYLGAVQM